MTPNDLAAAIKLHPRASVLSGTLAIRHKNQRTLRATTPFHLVAQNPVVEYLPDGRAEPRPNAAGIELSFDEDDNQLGLLSGYRRTSNFLQVSFGASNHAPTQAQYACLREAGSILDRLATSQTPVHAAVYPVLFPTQHGATSGAYIIMGVFGVDGTPFWLNPDAVAVQGLQSAWPADQQVRRWSDAPASASGADAVKDVHAVLTAVGLEGDALLAAMVKALQGKLGDAAEAAVAAYFTTKGGTAAPEAIAAAPAPTATVRTAVSSALTRLRKAGKKG
jgi:hypothetical protein